MERAAALAHSHRRAAYASTSKAGIQGPAGVGGSTLAFAIILDRPHPKTTDAAPQCCGSGVVFKQPSIHGRTLQVKPKAFGFELHAGARARARGPHGGVAWVRQRRGWRPAVVGTGGIQEDRVPGASDRETGNASDRRECVQRSRQGSRNHDWQTVTMIANSCRRSPSPRRARQLWTKGVRNWRDDARARRHWQCVIPSGRVGTGLALLKSGIHGVVS